MSEEITDWENWLTPAQVMQRVMANSGESEDGAKAAIWNRLTAGMIRAAAGRTSERQTSGNPIVSLKPSLIMAAGWNQYQTYRPSRLWQGEAEFVFREGNVSGYVKEGRFACFDIRFDPDNVEREFPGPQHSQSPAAATRNKGGRPPYNFWDDLWAEIARQLVKGELTIRQQKDIEIAMKTFAENHEPDIADSTIRVRAQKLARALGIKVEN